MAALPLGIHCWRQLLKSLTEILPLADRESGCTITADVRLDNRDQLIAAFSLSNETRIIGDGELILRAYLLWGEACPEHLLGDFAFAIWDPRANQLFCARDHMGMRPLIYHHRSDHVFVFASEPEVILTHAGVPRRINQGRIADFLDNLEGLDFTSTFFEAIFRLAPAHCLTVSNQGLSLRRYWELQPQPELKLASDEAYAKAFLEVFTEAVRCRLRSAGPVGSMLSGGMDSGAVVAVASAVLAADGHGPLATFSAIAPYPEKCVETRAIHAASAMPGLAPHWVSHAELETYSDDLLRLTAQSEEPFDGQMALPRAVYLAAHRAGINVVLDGVAGDTVLSSDSYVPKLLRGGRLIQAILEARGERLFWGKHWPFWRVLVRGAWRAFAPRQIRAAKRHLDWRLQDRMIGKTSLISLPFARRINLLSRRKLVRRRTAEADGLDTGERVRAIRHTNLVVGRERYGRVAAALAIEPRDPFIDLRLIRFCLSLPYAQLQVDGWPKAILRNAMRGKLPDSVIWRRGKEHLGWSFSTSLFSLAPTSLDLWARMTDVLENFVNLE